MKKIVKIVKEVSDDSDEEKAEKEEFQKQLNQQYNSQKRTKAEKQEFQKQLDQKYLELKAAAEDGKDSDDENDDGFQIFVKNFEGETLTCIVKPTDTIDNLKGQIKVKEGITFKFSLVTGGHQLEDNRTVSDYNIEKETTLHMLHWIKGGGKILILSWKSCSINLLFFM